MSEVTNLLDGRRGWRLRGDWGHVSVLAGGGHICELSLASVPGVNPLWRPQWTTIDPQCYTVGRHARTYGPPPDGRLLAGIAGHSLSFDHFGPPSKEETDAGLSTHGEAPSQKWRRLKSGGGSRLALRCGCVLKEAQIEFSRTLTTDRRVPVIYCEERAENLSCFDRPISWNEHVTFGPPFLECGTTLFDMPATRAKVCPAGYSQRMALQPDAEFRWPNASRKDGQRQNLRTMPEECFGHYTAQLLDPRLEIAFISACNPRLGLLVVYAFRRADFPWVGNWEERNHRASAPWKERTFCRGMEFSTTPFAVPRRESVDQGRLFGEATFRWLPAKSSVAVRFVILLFKVPEDFGGVREFKIAEGCVVATEASKGGRELSLRVGSFLQAESAAAHMHRSQVSKA